MARHSSHLPDRGRGDVEADPAADRALSAAAASFVARHRWGFVTLGAAAFVWGVGAVSTPAPAIVGGALAGVAALAAMAVARFRARRRRGAHRAERARTRISLALYGTSLLLAALFLAGVFMAPRSATLAAAAVPMLSTRIPALAAVPALAAAPDTLRILSLNVWHGYPGPGAREERYRRLRDLVAEAEADVVLLQEAWSTRGFGRLAERLSRELGMAYAYTRANGSLRYLGFEEGLTILSPHPLSEVRRLALGPRTPPWEMRAALGAVVSLPHAPALEVWTTHLSHSSAAGRQGQSRSLAAALAGSRAALLAGDFNAAAASAAVTTFEQADLRPLVSEGIDHVLASPALYRDWTPVRAVARHFPELALAGGRTRPELSDHPALLVELRRSSGSPAGAALAAILPPSP